MAFLFIVGPAVGSDGATTTGDDGLATPAEDQRLDTRFFSECVHEGGMVLSGVCTGSSVATMLSMSLFASGMTRKLSRSEKSSCSTCIVSNKPTYHHDRVCIYSADK